jgi:hypothetical protein
VANVSCFIQLTIEKAKRDDPLSANCDRSAEVCSTSAIGTLKTYNVQNAVVNLSLCRINIYIRIFKLELTVTGLTRQY